MYCMYVCLFSLNVWWLQDGILRWNEYFKIEIIIQIHNNIDFSLNCIIKINLLTNIKIYLYKYFMAAASTLVGDDEKTGY